MAPKRSSSSAAATSPSSRAASLLAKARAAAAAGSPVSPKREGSTALRSGGASLPGHAYSDNSFQDVKSVASTSSVPLSHDGSKSKPLPLPQLLKQLTSCGLTMRESLPIAGKLIKGGFALPEKLAMLSPAALESIGVEGVELQRKVAAAFSGASKPPSKRRRRDPESDEVLSREWGNVSVPKGGGGVLSGSSLIGFAFHEVVDEADLKDRYVFVNRAPVMTAWATIVLERLGFKRPEALSIAHCYVSHTSTARGISLGILPASERVKTLNVVGPHQPHFELMGIKIPVMQIDGEEWRGISEGEVVGPEKAFNYLRKSMFQTLPLVMGALTLLADSFLEPAVQTSEPDALGQQAQVESDVDAGETQKEESVHDSKPDLAAAVAIAGSELQQESGPEALHAQAYNLYTLFRPDTGGEWGKRARFELDRVLELRAGSTADVGTEGVASAEADIDEEEAKEEVDRGDGANRAHGAKEEELDSRAGPSAVKSEPGLETSDKIADAVDESGVPAATANIPVHSVKEEKEE